VEGSIEDECGLSLGFDTLFKKRKDGLEDRSFLQARETYFVIVRADHLVGSQGIIEILKERGYLPEQL
jgi:uncharacterized protein YbaP (TraB family)